MQILRSIGQLSMLKQMLESGLIQPHQTTLLCQGLLQSTLLGLWKYEAVVDRWPDVPKAVIFRPIHSPQDQFLNRRIYIVSSDHATLKNLLQNPESLPWTTETLNFFRLSTSVDDAVKEASMYHGGTWQCLQEDPVYCFMSNGTLLNARVESPPGLQLGSLLPEHTDLVLKYSDFFTKLSAEPTFHEEWVNYTKFIIRTMPSYAFYDSCDNVVSWSTTLLDGSSGQTYTLPEYRGLNLFSLGSQHLNKQLDQRGRPFFAYARLSNQKIIAAARNFYTKVGEASGYFRHIPSPTKAKL